MAANNNNNNYAFAIDQTQPVADLNARNVLSDAPAILLGAQRTFADVSNANRELEARQNLKALQPPNNYSSVTSDEVVSSQVRQAVVVNEVAAGMYGTLQGAPAWAQAMQGSIDNMNNRFDNIDDRLNTMQDDMNNRFDNIDDRLNTMQAQITNVESRRFNQNAPAFGSLQPLVKEQPGYGPPLPGSQQQIDQNDPVADVGLLCPYFPETSEDLMGLTNNEISLLSQWFNDTFGIVAGDSNKRRREKLCRFSGRHA